MKFASPNNVDEQHREGVNMAKDLTGFRIAKVDIQAISSGTEKSQEMDFNFARGEGIAIYSVEFMMHSNEVASNTFADQNSNVSLHVENDSLEVTMEDIAVDGFTQDDSEIIAEANWGSMAQDEAATRGGSAGAMGWLSKHSWDYLQILGSPLVIAINPTLFVDFVGTGTADKVRLTMWYKYVELNDREVRDAFFRRR